MKRILSAIIAVVMMLSIAPVANIFVNTDTAITASAATTYYQVYNTGSNGLCLRKGPGTSYARIIVMPNGAKVKYLGKSGSFYKVSYTKSSKTYTGYASSSYLKKVTSSSSSSSASISSKDQNYLKNLFADFEWGSNNVSYSSSASNAAEKAYQTMFKVVYASVFDNFDYYGWSYSLYYSSKAKDPKNYASTYHAYGFYKFSASKVDWILKNVYGVKPDHSKIVKSNGTPYAYYSNGYYYFLQYGAGDVHGTYVFNSVSKSNGYYVIKGTAYSVYGDGEKWGTFSAKLKLMTVDGKKVWNIVTYSYKSV